MRKERLCGGGLHSNKSTKGETRSWGEEEGGGGHAKAKKRGKSANHVQLGGNLYASFTGGGWYTVTEPEGLSQRDRTEGNGLSTRVKGAAASEVIRGSQKKRPEKVKGSKGRKRKIWPGWRACDPIRGQVF